jgi:hypothetical protein
MQLEVETQACAPAGLTSMFAHVSARHAFLVQCQDNILLFQPVSASGDSSRKLIGRVVDCGDCKPTCCVSSLQAIYVGNDQGQILCASASGGALMVSQRQGVRA